MINYERKEVSKMAAKIDLTKYGITGTTEIVYNPSYEMLFEEETKPDGRLKKDRSANWEQLTL